MIMLFGMIFSIACSSRLSLPHFLLLAGGVGTVTSGISLGSVPGILLGTGVWCWVTVGGPSVISPRVIETLIIMFASNL